jgi:hypothetical protein
MSYSCNDLADDVMSHCIANGMISQKQLDDPEFEGDEGAMQATYIINGIDKLLRKNKKLKKELKSAIVLDAREHATMLAALRCFQQVDSECCGDIPGDLQDIADNGGTVKRLAPDEIDALCERINA